MSVAITVKADSTGLNTKLDSIASVFCKRGANPTMVQQFVKIEAAQLAYLIAQRFGPKKYDSTKTKIKKDLRKVFYQEPSELLDQSQSGAGDVRWIMAGPEFLAGVEKENDKTGLSTDEAIKVYYRAQLSQKYKGTKFGDMGVRRGKQRIMLLNRAMVGKSVLAGIETKIFDKIGKAKASFAALTDELMPGFVGKFPQWVRRHFAEVRSSGRSILDQSGVNIVEAPEVSIGSTAPGVETNPQMIAAYKSAFSQREKVAQQKLKQLTNDAVYNLNTGQVYKIGDRALTADEI